MVMGYFYLAFMLLYAIGCICGELSVSIKPHHQHYILKVHTHWNMFALCWYLPVNKANGRETNTKEKVHVYIMFLLSNFIEILI